MHRGGWRAPYVAHLGTPRACVGGITTWPHRHDIISSSVSAEHAKGWCAITDHAIKRGPWGKPWVTTDGQPLDWPEGERQPLNAELYDRPSDISGSLDTKENLSPYHQAKAVFGVVTEPHPHSLIKQFRALASEFTDPWSSAKTEVKDLLKMARTLGGEDFKSGSGAALHRYSVLIDKGITPEYEMTDFEPWLEVYGEAMARFEVLAWEGFIVADEVKCAGSFDKLLRDRETGDIIIGDLKTGKSDADFAMSPTVQVAIYAHGEYYDQETGKRSPVHADLRLDRGALIHLPYNGGGDPECTIYPLDLERGWQLAKTSKDVTAARKMRVTKKSALARAKRVPPSPTSDPS